MQAKRIRTMKDNHRGTLKAKKIHYSGWSTPNGSRTRAACLEGKHDNRFTIGVTSLHCTIQNNTINKLSNPKE
jgi:hypothetical protein